MIPVDLYALTVKPDISFTALLPKDSGSYRAYFGMRLSYIAWQFACVCYIFHLLDFLFYKVLRTILGRDTRLLIVFCWKMSRWIDLFIIKMVLIV